jgi:hypothetical protein
MKQAGWQPGEGGSSAKVPSSNDELQVLHSINQSFDQFMILPQQPKR